MSFMSHEQGGTKGRWIRKGLSMSILETDFFKYQIGSKEYDCDTVI